MSSCIFCDIISGKEPAYVIFEDDKIMAILDHRPTRPGHSLIIPKQHVAQFIDLDDDLAAHITVVGNKIARKIMQKIKPKPMRVGFVVHGNIPHVHYHIVPQHTEDDITCGRCAKIENEQIIFDNTLIPLASKEEQEDILNILKL